MGNQKGKEAQKQQNMDRKKVQKRSEYNSLQNSCQYLNGAKKGREEVRRRAGILAFIDSRKKRGKGRARGTEGNPKQRAPTQKRERGKEKSRVVQPLLGLVLVRKTLGRARERRSKEK